MTDPPFVPGVGALEPKCGGRLQNRGRISAAMPLLNSLHQGIYQRLFAINDLILQILPRICKFPSEAGI